MGAIIAGAKITATQTATGIRRDAVSNQDGLYVFSNMTPGDYELRIEAAGFAIKVTKTVLNVGQTVTLNAQLEVDVTKANVDQITYIPPLIDTSTSLIDGVIRSREVQSLPLTVVTFSSLLY